MTDHHLPLPMDHLAAARLWAVTRCPYLAAALHALTPVPRPGLGTVAVDRRWRMYVDPKAVRKWTVPQLGTALIHEVNHLLRDHHGRSPTILTEVDRRRWNVAGDAEINDDLVSAGLELIPGAITPRGIGSAPGQLAEEYWADLLSTKRLPGGGVAGEVTGRANSAQGPGPGPSGHEAVGGPLGGEDCGSCAGGARRDHELGDDGTGLGPIEAGAVRQRVARAVRSAATDTKVPKGLRRWANESFEEKVDWRRVLASLIRRAVGEASGATDYSYRRPSRRASALPGIVLPTLRRPVVEVAVVLDTSGSMDGKRLNAAVTEIDEVLASLGTDRDRLRVIACDTAVGPAQRIRSSHEVPVTSGGGTDMRVGISAALSLRPRPDVVIVLTDGQTDWPEHPTTARLVVALVNQQYVDEVPPWATTVVVTDA